MIHRFCQQLELHARYTIIGQLADGRQVLDLGCGDSVALEQLVLAGARKIVLASEHAHAALASADADTRGHVEALDELRLPLDFADASFDLVVCHDLADRLAQDPRWLPELRRVLAADGYLFLAVANPDGRFLSELTAIRGSTAFDYQATTNVLADVFGTVTVLGQSPMVASLFFDFEDTSDEPGLSLDPTLLPEDEDDQPGWYLLLCGPEPLHRDELSVVQLPFGQLIQSLDAHAGSTSRTPSVAAHDDPPAPTQGPAETPQAGSQQAADPRELEHHLERTLLRCDEGDQQLAALQGEMSACAQALANAAEQVETLTASCDHSQAVIRALEEDVRQRRAQLEASRAEHSARQQSYRAELLRSSQSLEQTRVVAAEATSQAAGLRARAAELEAQLELEKTARQRAEQRSADDGAMLRRAEAQGAESIAAATAAVQEAETRIQQAEADVAEQLVYAERQAQEVLRTVERQAEARLEQAQAEHAERLSQAEARAQEAEARCEAIGRQLQQGDGDLAARLQAERQARSAAQLACRQAETAAVAERQRAEEYLGKLQALQADAASVQKDPSHGDARLLALQQQELQRQASDRASLEEQVRGLLDEVGSLRGRVTQSEAGAQEAQGLRQQLADEQARFAQLVSELAQARDQLQKAELAHQSLAAETLRLTDALHEQQAEAARPQQRAGAEAALAPCEPTDPRRDASSGNPPSPRQTTSPSLGATPEPSAHGDAPASISADAPAMHDAAGREIADAMSGLEDLMKGSVKDPTS